jgi:hypothetical protein
MNSEDDGRFRSGLAAILGLSVATISLLFGRLDVETFLIATLVGSAVVAPVWRFVEESFAGPMTIVMYAAFVVPAAIILRQFPTFAFFAFLGGFMFVLGLLRVATGWRNPVLPPPRPELTGPVRPILVLVLAVPLMALFVVTVVAVAVERGLLR